MTKHGPSVAVAVIHIRKVSGSRCGYAWDQGCQDGENSPKLLKVNLIELYILNALVNIHRHRDTVSAHRKKRRPSVKKSRMLPSFTKSKKNPPEKSGRSPYTSIS